MILAAFKYRKKVRRDKFKSYFRSYRREYIHMSRKNIYGDLELLSNNEVKNFLTHEDRLESAQGSCYNTHSLQINKAEQA